MLMTRLPQTCTTGCNLRGQRGRTVEHEHDTAHDIEHSPGNEKFAVVKRQHCVVIGRVAAQGSFFEQSVLSVGGGGMMRIGGSYRG